MKKGELKIRRQLYRAMKPMQGFIRTICRCRDCGQLFGRQYIPHSLGRGLTLGACLCQLTAHRIYDQVSRRDP